MKTYYCQFCNKDVTTVRGKASHERLCKSNPNKVKHPMIGKKSKNQFISAKERGEVCRHSADTLAKISASSKTRKMSEETREKIRNSRIKFLTENPSQVPYLLNHSSEESYPEKRFRELLTLHNVTGWTQEHRIHLYSLDFAFLDIKLDVEIDGSTHMLPHVKEIDLRRDKFLVENGWRILRISAKELKHSPDACMEKLALVV